jgi:hypothetical protein
MSPVLAITIMIFAIVGGIIGWRRASRPMPRRPTPGPDASASELPSEAMEREERRRRLHRRYRLTTIYALLGVVVGLFALLLLDRQR